MTLNEWMNDPTQLAGTFDPDALLTHCNQDNQHTRPRHHVQLCPWVLDGREWRNGAQNPALRASPRCLMDDCGSELCVQLLSGNPLWDCCITPVSPTTTHSRQGSLESCYMVHIYVFIYGSYGICTPFIRSFSHRTYVHTPYDSHAHTVLAYANYRVWHRHNIHELHKKESLGVHDNWMQAWTGLRDNTPGWVIT